jgi:hypothetical protein
MWFPFLLGQSQWDFIRVLWTLIMLMWHHINEERDDKSFMGAERISWGRNSSALFPKSECVENNDMKSPLRLALRQNLVTIFISFYTTISFNTLSVLKSLFVFFLCRLIV